MKQAIITLIFLLFSYSCKNSEESHSLALEDSITPNFYFGETTQKLGQTYYLEFKHHSQIVTLNSTETVYGNLTDQTLNLKNETFEAEIHCKNFNCMEWYGSISNNSDSIEITRDRYLADSFALDYPESWRNKSSKTLSGISLSTFYAKSYPKTKTIELITYKTSRHQQYEIFIDFDPKYKNPTFAGAYTLPDYSQLTIFYLATSNSNVVRYGANGFRQPFFTKSTGDESEIESVAWEEDNLLIKGIKVDGNNKIDLEVLL